MSDFRVCARATCSNRAVATMTFSYRDATAVIGPLSMQPVPGALDLCEQHAASATVPIGWQLVRLQAELERSAEQHKVQDREDDLTALADALREAERAARTRADREKRQNQANKSIPNPWESHFELPAMRPHLRVIDGDGE